MMREIAMVNTGMSNGNMRWACTHYNVPAGAQPAAPRCSMSAQLAKSRMGRRQQLALI